MILTNMKANLLTFCSFVLVVGILLTSCSSSKFSSNETAVIAKKVKTIKKEFKKEIAKDDLLVFDSLYKVESGVYVVQTRPIFYKGKLIINGVIKKIGAKADTAFYTFESAKYKLVLAYCGTSNSKYFLGSSKFSKMWLVDNLEGFGNAQMPKAGKVLSQTASSPNIFFYIANKDEEHQTIATFHYAVQYIHNGTVDVLQNGSNSEVYARFKDWKKY